MATTKAQQMELLASGILYDAELLTTPYAKFLAAGTTTAKTAWDDANKAVAITKKKLNSQGRAIVYGDGVYKIQVYDGDPDAGGVLKFEIDNYKVIALIGNTRTITTDTTGSTDDSLVKVDTTSGNVTYTLPDAALMAGQLLQVVKSVAANTATIAAASGQTVNGSASVSLTKAFSSGTFQSDGTSWFSTSDAASVAGFVPDTGTTAGTIPVRDGSGDLPGNILGSAAKVGVLNVKVVDIGDWNMQSTANIDVAHGLTFSKIRDISVTVRSDDQLTVRSLRDAGSWNTETAGTVVRLFRSAGAPWDSISYNDTSFNRGWITIWYVD